MTAFNRADFIAEAIESVMRSSFDNFELIVVDDASTDDTAGVAKEYQARDTRIRVHSNPENLGDYANRNQAASYARGTYIKYLDSDDVIYPHGLATMVECMETFPSAALGLSSLPDPAGPCPLLLTPRDAYRQHYLAGDLLGRAPGSTIIRRDAFDAVGGFSGKRQVGDHELWLRIARKYPVVKMPTDLVWDRSHPAQEKHYDDEAEKAAMHDKVRWEALTAEDCPLSEDERSAARRRFEESQGRTYWTLVRNGGGPRAATRYRNAAGVSLGSIRSAAMNKILLRGRT
jgi:glycosyltransferase involved in cell wall biosynthesis